MAKIAEVKIGDFYAYKTSEWSSWYDERGIVVDPQYEKLLEALARNSTDISTDDRRKK